MAEHVAKKHKRVAPPSSTIGHMSKEPRLKGRVAVISGAGQGFGQAIAVRFVEEGCKVVMFSRRGCAETAAMISKIEGLDVPVDSIVLDTKADLSDEKSLKAMVAATVAKFGKLDILVNNAASFVFESVETATAEDWDWTCAVNIKGHALTTKACLPYLKESDSAAVVFQGSISSFVAQPNCATYATVKGAIVQLARNCAYDFSKYGIRVNSVCAGTIETPISATEREAHGWTYDEWEALKIKDVMLRRVGHVREVANATLFYACSESTYCTGSHLMVDGGQTACTVMDD